MPTKFRTGSKTFEITGYSFTKCIGDKNFIQSDRFTIGGYDWALEFYPHGFNNHGVDHVAAGLRLLSDGKEAKAIRTFYLKDFSTNQWTPMMTADSSKLLTYNTMLNNGGGSAMWGRDKLIKRSDLEAPNSKYLKDDTLAIMCTLWVSN